MFALPPFRQIGDIGMDQRRWHRVEHFGRVQVEMDRGWAGEKNIGEILTGAPFAEELGKQIAAPAHRCADQLDLGIALLKRRPDRLGVADRVSGIDGDFAFLSAFFTKASHSWPVAGLDSAAAPVSASISFSISTAIKLGHLRVMQRSPGLFSSGVGVYCNHSQVGTERSILTSAPRLSLFRLALQSNKPRLFQAVTFGITVAQEPARRSVAMMYDMFRRSLIAAAMSLGSFFAVLALGKKRKNLLAVSRHRPEP